jgi:hypothetical protein
MLLYSGGNDRSQIYLIYKQALPLYTTPVSAEPVTFGSLPIRAGRSITGEMHVRHFD